MIAREPTAPPPHNTANGNACGYSISIAMGSMMAPPARRPAMKAERKTTERGHLEKRDMFCSFCLLLPEALRTFAHLDKRH